MFVLKSTLKRQRDEYERVLGLERDAAARVREALQAQIEDLRKLVFVQEPTPIQEHPIRVANAILDGQEVLPQKDPKLEAEELAEANRILSGNYDNFEEAW